MAIPGETGPAGRWEEEEGAAGSAATGPEEAGRAGPRRGLPAVGARERRQAGGHGAGRVGPGRPPRGPPARALPRPTARHREGWMRRIGEGEMRVRDPTHPLQLTLLAHKCQRLQGTGLVSGGFYRLLLNPHLASLCTELPLSHYRLTHLQMDAFKASLISVMFPDQYVQRYVVVSKRG